MHTDAGDEAMQARAVGVELATRLAPDLLPFCGVRDRSALYMHMSSAPIASTEWCRLFASRQRLFFPGRANVEIMRRAMTQAGQGVRPGLCALVLAIGCMLVMARVTQGRASQRNHQDAGEENKPVVRAAAAASRSIRGNNKTIHSYTFPWIIYFYRNPDPQFKVPLDGYLTGFGLELARDVLLINKAVVDRATKEDIDTGETLMMAARRVMNTPVIDPSKSLWPTGGECAHMGVLDWVGNITDTWAVYWVRSIANDQADNWRRDPNPRHCGSGRSDCGEKWREFPNLAYPDSDLDINCYAYSISAVDWKAANEYALKYGLPAYPDYLVKAKNTENTQRYFSRWPVKLNSCWDKKDGTLCEFVYDEARREEDFRRGKFNTHNPQLCGTFQDVGAPIMCGNPLPPFETLFRDYTSTYYERAHLTLQFVIEPPDNVDPTKPMVNNSACTGSIIARKLAPYIERFKTVTATSRSM